MSAPASLSSIKGYLLDTSVLSALAPDRRAMLPDAFAGWLLRRSDRLFIPCIAIAEIEQGICKLHRAGSTGRAENLSKWLDGLIEGYAESVLPLNARSSRLAGQISERALSEGRHPGFPDVAIAALAQDAQLLLLTRNLKHFAPLHVLCVDPLETLPD